MSSADRTKWNARWEQRGSAEPRPPEVFVTAQAAHLPPTGRALDLAGGNGRHALWLAERGLEVTLLDVSPVALQQAAAAAARRGLNVTTLELDCDAIDAGEASFPSGPWAVIVCHHFLWRPLFAHAARELAEGGVLLFAQPTRRNLERHPHPSEHFLLPPGELAAWVSPHLEILGLEETWHPNGRHEAQLRAVRPASAGHPRK